MSENTVIPFGKYRGQELQQVMARDPAYIQWLTQQAWFSERFAPIYQLVINNFAPPSDETPEHNALQVRFLDFDFRTAFWDLINLKVEWKQRIDNFQRAYPNQEHKRFCTLYQPKFEDYADVVFKVECGVNKSDGTPSHARYTSEAHCLAIEIKPSMGDDYPAVLRQIKRQQITAQAQTDWPKWFLLLEKFSSNAVTLAQVRKIFANDQITIVLMSDVRERLLKSGT